jgi:hypothetical protein
MGLAEYARYIQYVDGAGPAQRTVQSAFPARRSGPFSDRGEKRAVVPVRS